MQPVGQLDDDHADVLRHGEKHLAQAFDFLLFLGDKIEPGQLGNAIDQHGDLRAEFLLDGFNGDVLNVFHAVVQQPGGNRRRVQHQIGEDQGNRVRMVKIGLAGFALLVLVRGFGKIVGLLHERHVFVGVIAPDRIDQLAKLFITSRTGTAVHAVHSIHLHRVGNQIAHAHIQFGRLHINFHTGGHGEPPGVFQADQPQFPKQYHGREGSGARLAACLR